MKIQVDAVKSIGGLVLLIAVAALITSLTKNKEGFFSAGSYPCSVDGPLLIGSYKEKKDPGYNVKSTAEAIYPDYPDFPADHCGTNNIRYWRRPTNGTCSPPGFCRALYEDTEPVIPPPPNAPPFTSVPRVNFYVARD
jgi:hypothetical protein